MPISIAGNGSSGGGGGTVSTTDTFTTVAAMAAAAVSAGAVARTQGALAANDGGGQFWYWDTTDFRKTLGSVSGAAFTIVAHGFQTGQAVTYKSGGTLAGLTDGTTYYVRYLTADTFELYTSWIETTRFSTTVSRITPSGTPTGTLEPESDVGSLVASTVSTTGRWRSNPLSGVYNTLCFGLKIMTGTGPDSTTIGAANVLAIHRGLRAAAIGAQNTRSPTLALPDGQFTVWGTTHFVSLNDDIRQTNWLKVDGQCTLVAAAGDWSNTPMVWSRGADTFFDGLTLSNLTNTGANAPDVGLLISRAEQVSGDRHQWGRVRINIEGHFGAPLWMLGAETIHLDKCTIRSKAPGVGCVRISSGDVPGLTTTQYNTAIGDTSTTRMHIDKGEYIAADTGANGLGLIEVIGRPGYSVSEVTYDHPYFGWFNITASGSGGSTGSAAIRIRCLNTIALTAAASTGATSLTIAPLAFNVPTGQTLTFASGLTAVMNAAYTAGGTTISVNALSAGIASGDTCNSYGRCSVNGIDLNECRLETYTNTNAEDVVFRSEPGVSLVAPSLFKMNTGPGGGIEVGGPVARSIDIQGPVTGLRCGGMRCNTFTTSNAIVRLKGAATDCQIDVGLYKLELSGPLATLNDSTVRSLNALPGVFSNGSSAWRAATYRGNNWVTHNDWTAGTFTTPSSGGNSGKHYLNASGSSQVYVDTTSAAYVISAAEWDPYHASITIQCRGANTLTISSGFVHDAQYRQINSQSGSDIVLTNGQTVTLTQLGGNSAVDGGFSWIATGGASSSGPFVYSGTWASRPTTGLTAGNQAFMTDWPRSTFIWNGSAWRPTGRLYVGGLLADQTVTESGSGAAQAQVTGGAYPIPAGLVQPGDLIRSEWSIVGALNTSNKTIRCGLSASSSGISTVATCGGGNHSNASLNGLSGRGNLVARSLTSVMQDNSGTDAIAQSTLADITVDWAGTPYWMIVTSQLAAGAASMTFKDVRFYLDPAS